MNAITILLADDHTIVREALAAYLKTAHDIKVLGQACDGRQAVEMTRTLKPDVVVMDVAMPLLNGIAATRQILHYQPGTKVLMLSAYSDVAYVDSVMELGARGYLSKQTDAEALPHAIRQVHQGNIYYSPAIARQRHHHEIQAKARGDLHASAHAGHPSPRENELLVLIAGGKGNQAAADLMHISIKTVEKHRQSLMDKLNIHHTAGLTQYAVAQGLISCGLQESPEGDHKLQSV